ncbi:unnamed protein product [Haemonchus placei]|uniref:Sulfate_transp domain-containing protein n=1 Tax=Haemonchus placei TaxID=6290 RepID=A0A0N4WEX8_HAEPC|nr:unnamed protein product [Haemonchus placei]
MPKPYRGDRRGDRSRGRNQNHDVQKGHGGRVHDHGDRGRNHDGVHAGDDDGRNRGDVRGGGDGGRDHVHDVHGHDHRRDTRNRLRGAPCRGALYHSRRHTQTLENPHVLLHMLIYAHIITVIRSMLLPFGVSSPSTVLVTAVVAVTSFVEPFGVASAILRTMVVSMMASAIFTVAVAVL